MKETIEFGTLMKNINGIKISVTYKMVFLDESHLKEILSLQTLVHTNIEDKRLFVPDPEDFIKDLITSPNKGIALGVFVEKSLIAFRTISFPGKSLLNLGRDLHLSAPQLLKVAHLESTVVHPDYRGNRLQAKILIPSLNYIQSCGYENIFVTISPYNYPSLSTIIKAGFVIRELKNRNGLYRGKVRFLLEKNLLSPSPPSYNEVLSIDHHDTSQQKQVLKEGYVGFKLQKYISGYQVLYGR